MSLTKLSDLSQLLIDASIKPRLVVAVAADDYVLAAVSEAASAGYVFPILVGDADKIKMVIEQNNFVFNQVEIVDEPDDDKAVYQAVAYIAEGKADILMKGLISTGTLLKRVLDKTFNLKASKVMSHLAFFEMPSQNRVVAVTDAAMNIDPDLNQKVAIVENSVSFMRKIGYELPKVAAIAAVEVVNPAMQATLDASALTVMNLRGQIKNCVIDGPLALDNAVSMESAQHKKITSDVAGQADLLLAPNLDSGNILYKAFAFIGHSPSAAVILGAKCPIVLTSRADSPQSKLNSIMLAAAALVLKD